MCITVSNDCRLIADSRHLSTPTLFSPLSHFVFTIIRQPTMDDADAGPLLTRKKVVAVATGEAHTLALTGEKPTLYF